ncbi:helix-turn-helix domain-containing protein [Paenibacillus sp. EC2-1]|uniref:helix-turn-helix domain-containing protein n=1 Tax=Paenibacillus sp. EC2-1 TaxID=3388665 RepID=UPI003BEEBBB6
MNEEIKNKKRVTPEYLEVGKYIKSIRKHHGETLIRLGCDFDLSANYISEIERGVKPPSEQFINKFCERFKIEPKEVYSRLKRAPEHAVEELNTNIVAQELLLEIGKNKKLKQQDKERIYNQLLQWYKEVIDTPKK